MDLFKAMELPTYDYGVDMYHKFGQERVLSDPGVPVHIFYGTGLDTTCAMDYRNKRFPDYSPKECSFSTFFHFLKKNLRPMLRRQYCSRMELYLWLLSLGEREKNRSAKSGSQRTAPRRRSYRHNFELRD